MLLHFLHKQVELISLTKVGIVLIISLFFTNHCFSQKQRLATIKQDTPEIKSWTAVHVDKNINSKLYASMKVSFHTKTPIFTPRFFDVGLKYRIFPSLTVASFYRFSNKFEVNERRAYVELSHHKKIVGSPINLKSRLRWQTKFSLENQMVKQLIRPMITLKIAEPEWLIKPYLSTELFYNKGQIERQRLSLGTSIRLNNHTAVKVFGRLELEDPYLYHKTHIYTFNLSYRFKF